MKFEYDLITIGLGPADMAVSIMGSEMGLKVCAGETWMMNRMKSKTLQKICKFMFRI